VHSNLEFQVNLVSAGKPLLKTDLLSCSAAAKDFFVLRPALGVGGGVEDEREVVP